MNKNTLIDEWAEAASICFVNRSYGAYTTSSVSRNDLQQLVDAAVQTERDKWRKEVDGIGLLSVFLSGWKLSEGCKNNKMEPEVQSWIDGLIGLNRLYDEGRTQAACQTTTDQQ